MESLINYLGDLNLSNIGDRNYSGNKRNDVRGLLSTQLDNVDLVSNLYEDIKSINTLERIENFNHKFRLYVNEPLIQFTQSEHGILNVGKAYSTYLDIKDKISKIIDRIKIDTTLSQSEKKILIYCILPIHKLPIYNRKYNPDKKTGEKTFSKMLLNLAVMHSKCRYEFVQGFYVYHQTNFEQ